MSNIQCANPKAQYLSKKDEIDNKIAETLKYRISQKTKSRDLEK